MKELFTTFPVAAWSIVSVLLALVIVVSLWEKVKWWWFNTWVSFPFVGRIATLSKDGNPDVQPGWFKGERTLCQEYKNFVRIQDEHDFNEKISYLTKAGDNGRKATPMWIWMLTVSMVLVEAMGFSYVLAGYTLPGASENLQGQGALGIAFLISVILVAFTHLAGHELYVSGLIQNARREWVENKKKHDLGTGTIPLASPQSSDDGQPAYSQLCNRVGKHPSYKLFGLTVVFVLLVASLATYVRGQVLEKELTQRISQSAEQANTGSKSANTSLDMSSPTTQLPDADVNSDKDANKKVVTDEVDIDRHGGWATFIVLAFVFIFLQILGIIFGYRWGFAGQNSADAFIAIGKGRYSSYAAVREHYQQIADTAQAKLSVLQQEMMARNSSAGASALDANKTFRDFIQETRIALKADRENERVTTEVKVSQPQTVVTPVAMPPAEPIAAPRPISAATVEQIMAQLNAMGEDKNAKKILIASLTTEMGAEVRAALKIQKEEKERKARENDLELEDLL